jgi:hypothetical protein
MRSADLIDCSMAESDKSIFIIAFELQESDKLANQYFRESKRLGIKLEYQQEYWWSLPFEAKEKWRKESVHLAAWTSQPLLDT